MESQGEKNSNLELPEIISAPESSEEKTADQQPGEVIEQPAKVMRVGTMMRQLL